MKYILWIILATFMAGCGYRGIPPEISSIYEQRRPITVKPEVIIVDAGHGGKDAGAASVRNKYEEKELTLSTAFLIRQCLQRLGYKTIMTRSQDVYVPLSTRAEMANSYGADLFVSIHYNYSSNNEAKGVEVYYYKEGKNPPSSRIVQSKTLGVNVLRRLISQTGAESRGLKQANFAVVRETRMPAILVEAGFLSNPQERARVGDPQYQRLIAWGIAHGVDQYLEAKRRR